MRITTVSLTGADDSISPSSLDELARVYPFVEFGILFSQSRQGSDRYPSRDWVEKLCDVSKSHLTDTGRRLRLAAHLCGDYARRFIQGYSDVWLDDWPSESLFFDRVQLNIADADFMDIDFLSFMKESQRGNPPWKEIILQTKRPFTRGGYLSSANAAFDRSGSLLYDTSGGKGLAPKSWPLPFVGVRCGYAGGLNPTNVAEVLEKLVEFPGQDSWIDMETGVRDAVGFSLEKCEEVLSISRRYISYS